MTTTESFSNYNHLEKKTTSELLQIINKEDKSVPLIIEKSLKEISDPEYFDCCKALVEKFWVSNENKSLVVRRKKIWAALQYRGWETELIMENILSLERQKE